MFLDPSLIVMKFGGAALQDIAHLKRSCDIIEKRAQTGSKLVVIVSAMGKTTDYLLNLASEVSSAAPKRELDMLLSAGERISMALVSMELQSRGLVAHSFTGSQAGIITDDCHSDAQIVDVKPFRILEDLQKGSIPIIAGFQGVSLSKEITTLGRGGSDTTACAMGVALKAGWVEFYKDVPGVFSNDPKVDPEAICYDELDYDQAFAIVQHSSKKLLHPRALIMAKKNKLPLFIQSFQKESLPQNRNGSWIKTTAPKHFLDPIYEVYDKECLNYSQNTILSSTQ